MSAVKRSTFSVVDNASAWARISQEFTCVIRRSQDRMS